MFVRRAKVGIWILLLAGCRGVATPATVDVNPVASATTYPVVSATENPTAQATNTLIPTPTQTVTETYVPTLPVTEAQAKLINLVSSNGNCRLPCLWGIFPGESNVEDGINKLLPLNSISTITIFNNNDGTIQPRFVINNLIINFHLLYHAKNNIIIRLILIASASTETDAIYDSPDFGKFLNYYSLTNILYEYGRPSSVYLSTLENYSSKNAGPFDILLLYPDQGILLNYSTLLHVSGTNIFGCPANAHIEAYLYPVGNRVNFMDSITSDWHERLPSYKPLEETTPMTIDQFYQSFRKPTDQCVITPAEYWPTPDVPGD